MSTATVQPQATTAPERLRLFIDETTQLDESFGRDRNRYLSLSGVIMRTRLLKNVIRPSFDALRSEHFGHSDSRIVSLHRTCIRARTGHFRVLRDDIKRKAWGDAFLGFLRDTRFGVITVCVDKDEIAARKWKQQRDPYHFAMITMLERYFLCLQRWNMYGDVIAESRTPKEDERVRQAFQDFRSHSSWFISSAEIRTRITCHKIKILPKKADEIGLQVCDLIAAPSLYNCFSVYKQRPLPTAYTASIAEILEGSKYLRNPQTQKVEGHGRLWRPRPK